MSESSRDAPSEAPSAGSRDDTRGFKHGLGW